MRCSTMGMESQIYERPGGRLKEGRVREPVLEFHRGAEGALVDEGDEERVDGDAGEDGLAGEDEQRDALAQDEQIGEEGEIAGDSVAEDLENDPALVPVSASALLGGLHSLLEETSAAAGVNALATAFEIQKDGYEPDAPATGCNRSDSKFPSLAWLFPNHAGAGRSARHQQGHHLRARQCAGKKARPAARPSQGSLFGDHR